MKIGLTGPITINHLLNYFEISTIYDSKGLGGTSVNNLAIELWNRGHTISVISLDPELSKPKYFEGNRIKIYIGPYRRKHRMRDFFKRELEFLLTTINEDNSSLIHAHWTYEFAKAAIQSNKPHLITCRDTPLKVLKFQPDLYRLGRLFMAMWVYKNGKNFTTISPYMKRELDFWNVRLLGIIPNMIESDWFCLDRIENVTKNKRIISINNGWGKRKNLRTAIKAYNRLRYEGFNDYQFDMVGVEYGKNEKADIWTKRNQMGCGINFIGHKAYDELKNCLPNYEVLLHTSLEESFGNTLIEAMASKVPIVAGKNSGAVPWVLNYGKAGVLVDVGKPRDVVEGVKKLLKNVDYYNEIINHGYEHAKKTFHPDTITSQFEKLYNLLIRENNEKL